MALLGITARVVLALGITAGFAAGVILYTGATFDTPNVVRGCEGIFAWSLVLISCSTDCSPRDPNRESTDRKAS